MIVKEKNILLSQLLFNCNIEKQKYDFLDLVSFTTQLPDTSDMSATQVRHECYTNNTSAAEVKIFYFNNDTSEKTFSHPILAIWQMKECKERNNFILRTTFWKRLVPMPNCLLKVHHKN